MFLSLTYNPLTVSLSSAQLLIAERYSKRSSRYPRRWGQRGEGRLFLVTGG